MPYASDLKSSGEIANFDFSHAVALQRFRTYALLQGPAQYMLCKLYSGVEKMCPPRVVESWDTRYLIR